MDPFTSCPYNASHRVPRSRLQGHIIKCQNNYPPLMVCPYNATHRFPDSQIKEHCSNCPDKEALYPERVPRTHKNAKGDIITPKPIHQRDYLPETDPNHECWDD